MMILPETGSVTKFVRGTSDSVSSIYQTDISYLPGGGLRTRSRLSAGQSQTLTILDGPPTHRRPFCLHQVVTMGLFSVLMGFESMSRPKKDEMGRIGPESSTEPDKTCMLPSPGSLSAYSINGVFCDLLMAATAHSRSWSSLTNDTDVTYVCSGMSSLTVLSVLAKLQSQKLHTSLAHWRGTTTHMTSLVSLQATMIFKKL